MSEKDAVDARYYVWKRNTQYVYDMLVNSNVTWPSLSLCWGPVLPQAGEPSPSPQQHSAISLGGGGGGGGAGSGESGEDDVSDAANLSQYTRKQLLYCSGRTDADWNPSTWKYTGHPHTLQVAEVDVARPHATNYRGLGKFSENKSSTSFRVVKTIIHPGEVNRILAWAPDRNLVVTHSDAPSVFFWNMKRQPARRERQHSEGSIPELILEGHTAIAE